MVGGRQAGYRAAETSQSSRTKPDYHTYHRSKKKVIKSYCESWFSAFDKNGNEVPDLVDNVDDTYKVKIEWQIQKNRRNKEPLTYVRDDEHPEFCYVRAIARMVARARRLGQDPSLPLAVYKGKDGKMKYLTARDMTAYIRDVAKSVHPNLTKAQLAKYSCHSMRVWACVLLFEAGKKGDYIKKRLRWLSDCYRVYLRDTEGLASMHNGELSAYSALIKAMQLTSLHMPTNVDYLVDEDTEMGDYIDIDGYQGIIHIPTRG